MLPVARDATFRIQAAPLAIVFPLTPAKFRRAPGNARVYRKGATPVPSRFSGALFMSQRGDGVDARGPSGWIDSCEGRNQQCKTFNFAKELWHGAAPGR